MTHEGRMSRGEAKYSRGIIDSETDYYLQNKPVVETAAQKKKREAAEAKAAEVADGESR